MLYNKKVVARFVVGNFALQNFLPQAPSNSYTFSFYNIYTLALFLALPGARDASIDCLFIVYGARE
jgi:hypothetical protein